MSTRRCSNVRVSAFALFCSVVPVACLSASAAEFRVTALTPEYILFQGDCSADENAAFFADPRFEESKSAGADWQIRRKRVALHEDIVKKVREPFA